MRITIKLDSNHSNDDWKARQLADDIWELKRAGSVEAIVIEWADGRRFLVVGDPEPKEKTS